MLNNKYVISFTAALILSVSAGHAGNGKGNNGNGNGNGGSNGNGNGNNGNSGTIRICHLEADGSYTPLDLKAIPAMNHLENHGFDGEGDRVANDDGTCDFTPVVDWGTCPCVTENAPWANLFGSTNPQAPIQGTILQDVAQTTTYTSSDITGNLFELVAAAAIDNETLECSTYDDESLQTVEVGGAAASIIDCRDGLYKLYNQPVPEGG